MSKEKLNEKLQKLVDEILESAKEVQTDYENNPSEISGSIIQIHEDSPFIDERVPGSGEEWKKVIINTPSMLPKINKKG